MPKANPLSKEQIVAATNKTLSNRAAARYLNEKQQGRKIIPDCMFLKGDSSKNIKNGDAFTDDKNKLNNNRGN